MKLILRKLIREIVDNELNKKSDQLFHDLNFLKDFSIKSESVKRAKSILNHNQSLSNYIKMMNSIKDLTDFNFDEIVSELIN